MHSQSCCLNIRPKDKIFSSHKGFEEATTRKFIVLALPFGIIGRKEIQGEERINGD